MTAADQPYLARAMVNRTWAHFFGYAFTTPIDDMGPHNPPSHPELLERLSEEFVKSGYDVKRLVRAICGSQAYGLTSRSIHRSSHKAAADDPALGKPPLFSRMYPKALEAEQLYDSLLVATEAGSSDRGGSAASDKERDEWLKQFIIAFGTDENDEATTFNGTVPQALLMMNGPLVQKAISAGEGSFLRAVLSSDGSDLKKIQRLYLATLSRLPGRREEAAALGLVSSGDKLAGYQDVFWALLNSNEFIINH
jgi:hypothetical protein